MQMQLLCFNETKTLLLTSEEIKGVNEESVGSELLPVGQIALLV